MRRLSSLPSSLLLALIASLGVGPLALPGTA
jgi:hypothetical protein